MSRITINQLPQAVKRGQAQPKDYWNDDYFKQLDPLVAALKEEAPDAKYDAKALVFMLVHLLHFQEAALGKDAMPPRTAPKLPIKLITDPSVGGALHAMALKLADIRRSRQLKAIEWQNPGKRKECMEILLVLRRELERRGLLVVPHVHISPSCGTEVQRLREYVRRLQGQLAESPDEPGVTHIVYPFGEKGDPDDGKEYSTLLAVKGDQARVHYWYMPDSYDAWIPLDSVDNKEVVPDRVPPGGVWKVTPRWIIDSEKYNEWMNPADYTTPEMEAEMDAAEAADAKGGKRAGAALAGQAKKARTDSTLEVDPEPLQLLGPTARLRKVLQPHKGMLEGNNTVENLSQGQINTHLAAYMPQVPPVQRPPPEAAAAADGQQAPQQQQAAPDSAAAAAAGRPPPAPPRPPPAAAGWFKANMVHPIERAALPEFCNGQTEKTITMYRQYRDGMLSLYWEHPERDLTFAEVRQHIDGEVNGLMRIYEMLQSWGLINVAGKEELQQVLSAGPGLSAHMPPGTASLYQFKLPTWLEATSAAQAGGMYGSATAAAAGGDGSRLLHPVAGRKGTEEGSNPSCLTRITCSAMPWVDCTRLRYHCTKLPDINLCPLAFAKGDFPAGTCSKDFVRIDDSQRHNSSDGWTPEETMLLLEGVELYKEDWAKIASHVGKSQAACLTHFVRLPIEDPFIDDLIHWGDATQRQQQQKQQQQQQLPPLPFQEEPNALMSTLGVLSIIMGPRVSAPAAQTALQALAEQDLEAGAVLNPEVRLAAVQAAAKQGAANGQLKGQPPTQQQQQQQQQEQNADDMNGVEMQDAAASLPQQQQQQQDPVGDDQPPPPQKPDADPMQQIDKPLVVSAVAAGLAAAATRAQQLARNEEREIQRLMVGLVDVAAKKVDGKAQLLQQLHEAQGLERDTTQVIATIKPLQTESLTVKTQVKQAQALHQQREAARQKAEAAKKQAAEAAAAARQKERAAAAAAAQKHQEQQQKQQQQQQVSEAAAKAPNTADQQQQQPPQQQLPTGMPSTPTPAAASAVAAAAGAGGGGGGVLSPAAAGSQQQQQQLSQSQQQELTPGKSTVSSGGVGGADSGLLDDDDDLGELLEGDLDLDDDDLLEDDDMPDGDMP